MIAWKHIEMLRGEIGEDDFQDIVVVFLEEVEEALEALTPGMTPDDMAASLHFLKGSALNLGFQTFAAACETGECALKRGGACNIDLEDLRDTYTRSRASLLKGLDDPIRAAG